MGRQTKGVERKVEECAVRGDEDEEKEKEVGKEEFRKQTVGWKRYEWAK